MFDKRRFKAQVILSGKTMPEIASRLNINVATLYRKMSGVSDFYRAEIQVICECLGIEDPNEIFFSKKVT